MLWRSASEIPCAKANRGRQLAKSIKNRSNGLFLSINNELKIDEMFGHLDTLEMRKRKPQRSMSKLTKWEKVSRV
jgi:hypothetical protein